MLTDVFPKLPFIDKESTLEYYTERLGFTLISDYGDYFILRKDKVVLHFFSFPTLQPKKSDFMIYLEVDEDIESLYESLQEKGVPIHPNAPLSEKPWKRKEFALIDPNGTLLTFGQSV
ncbi:VOC family protein [Marinilongibacter aquaticus]|uniref:bleomycin resistance protein n=1 Tax=Marinilongibacter aquaticus TaxID=2975157 RepID=UPI0021BD9CBE|nr:VOC family protein [Marinilongibacter aquaticus]UBM59099.1 VOC family protein [Marinilongibacter aquaticus]